MEDFVENPGIPAEGPEAGDLPFRPESVFLLQPASLLEPRGSTFYYPETLYTNSQMFASSAYGARKAGEGVLEWCNMLRSLLRQLWPHWIAFSVGCKLANLCMPGHHHPFGDVGTPFWLLWGFQRPWA